VAADYVKFLRENTELVKPEELDRKTCRDPNDLMVLGLVSPGEAEASVTGDKDLLVIGAFRGAAIITPRPFWEFSQSEA
jgi:putative PIN family toxin of toxin-antitoxin system